MKSEIRNSPGHSSYFGGGYRGYGRYQWNIKFYGFESEFEIGTALMWCLGDYSFKKGEFECLNDVVGRPVKAHTAGRSGGWLVIDTELTDAELQKVDRHIEYCLKALPEFLAEERKLTESEGL